MSACLQCMCNGRNHNDVVDKPFTSSRPGDPIRMIVVRSFYILLLPLFIFLSPSKSTLHCTSEHSVVATYPQLQSQDKHTRQHRIYHHPHRCCPHSDSRTPDPSIRRSLSSNLFIYLRCMGGISSDGQFATHPNTSAGIDFRGGSGGAGMLIGLTSRSPYTDGQDRKRDPLVLYGQPFMISANHTDTGDVVEFVVERWTLARGPTLLPTQTSPVRLQWTPPLILQRMANIHTSSCLCSSKIQTPFRQTHGVTHKMLVRGKGIVDGFERVVGE